MERVLTANVEISKPSHHSSASEHIALPSPIMRHNTGSVDLEKADGIPDKSSDPQVEKQPEPTWLVDFDGPDDTMNPQNYTRAFKWTMTMFAGLMTFCVTFASSVFSTGTVKVAEEFHVSDEVVTLGTSLYLMGYVIGPLIWGPMSELYGRRGPLFIGFIIFCIFQVPVAVAQNLQTIMVCRFFGGVFGASPLVTLVGMVGDCWGPVDRGVALTGLAAATFVGPVAGPIVGGFITNSSLGWRWTAWMTLIISAACGIAGYIVLPETSHPVILQTRAKKLRFETHNWALHSKLDEKTINIKTIFSVYLIRPLQMTVQEPILALVTLYMAFIYGIIFLFFEAYPISFQKQRGWNNGVGALPFFAILLGIVVGSILIIVNTKTRFARSLTKNGKIIPEERLPPMMLGAILLPMGLFWFAWTSSPHITWVPQVLAGIPTGCGIFMIFLQGMNYIVDVYTINAASAIAANTMFRSLAGAIFPLFANYMYARLGVAWATSLLAFLCIFFLPVPFLFFLYGQKLRVLSRFVQTT